MRFELVDDTPRPAVAGVAHDFQALEFLRLDVAEQMFEIRAARIQLLSLSLLSPTPWGKGRGGACPAMLILLRQRVNLFEARIAADRPRAFAHELHAVVIGRIVARG